MGKNVSIVAILFARHFENALKPWQDFFIKIHFPLKLPLFSTYKEFLHTYPKMFLTRKTVHTDFGGRHFQEYAQVHFDSIEG